VLHGTGDQPVSRGPASYRPRAIRQETNRTRATAGVFDCDDLGPSPIFGLPDARPLKALRTSTSLKENVMNDELEMELEIVELGDAKEETKGLPPGHTPEDGSTVLYRFA